MDFDYENSRFVIVSMILAIILVVLSMPASW